MAASCSRVDSKFFSNSSTRRRKRSRWPVRIVTRLTEEEEGEEEEEKEEAAETEGDDMGPVEGKENNM